MMTKNWKNVLQRMNRHMSLLWVRTFILYSFALIFFCLIFLSSFKIYLFLHFHIFSIKQSYIPRIWNITCVYWYEKRSICILIEINNYFILLSLFCIKIICLWNLWHFKLLQEEKKKFDRESERVYGLLESHLKISPKRKDNVLQEVYIDCFMSIKLKTQVYVLFESFIL